MQQIGIYACYDSTWYDLGWVLYAHLDNMAHQVDDVFDPTSVAFVQPGPQSL